MITLQKKADYDYIKKNGLEWILSKEDLKHAIESIEVNDLREYIFTVYENLMNNDIVIEDFYYGEHIYLSTEEFDMFSFKTIENIFELFGYNVELVEDVNQTQKNNGLWIGKMIISKDGFSFEMEGENTMHNKLISIFIDTKTAKITNK